MDVICPRCKSEQVGDDCLVCGLPPVKPKEPQVSHKKFNSPLVVRWEEQGRNER